MADSNNTGNTLNSILGLKHYVGCDSEWMDYIAFNVPSYEAFYKAKCTENDSSYPIDYTAHIYDPVNKTERTVKTVDASNGNCVVRIVHGAKCDVLPSRVHKGDTSMYVTHYAAGFWISGSRAVVFCGPASTRMRTAVSLMRARTSLRRSRARTTGRVWPSAENSL